MKKIILILVAGAAMLASAFNAIAIEPQWTKGTAVGAANFGFGPIGAEASFDYVVVDSWWKGHFTVGAQIDFATKPKTHYSALSAMPRATYGLNITDSFEVHVGVATGFGIDRYKYSDGDTDKSFYFANSEFAGLRFFLTDSFGLSAEVGYTTRMPYARVGVAFKF